MDSDATSRGNVAAEVHRVQLTFVLASRFKGRRWSGSWSYA